jgi:hypothetical protein
MKKRKGKSIQNKQKKINWEGKRQETLFNGALLRVFKLRG